MSTSTNYTSLAYVLETTEGEAPIEAPFQFQLLPTTGGSPVRNITTAVSEVIRDDRQTDDLTPVDASVSGDINFELSHDPYSPWLKALLQQDTTGAIAVSSITTDGADANTLAVAGIDTAIEIGDVFQLVSASDDPTVNGTYTCTDNSSSGEISIEPAMPTPLTGITDGVATTTTIIKNGADTPKSYTIRKTAIEGATTYRWYYYGCRVNTLNLNIATGSILNGSIGVVGRTETTGTSLLTNEGTDVEIPAYNIMNSVTSVGKIYLEGVTLGTCSFSSLDLTYDNQTNEAKSIGVLGACATASFSLSITGNVQVFFKDLALYNKFVNAESFGVTIILNDATNGATATQSIGINMPKCKFETLDTPIDGKDSFLVQTGTFRALRDETDDYMFKMSFVDKA